MFLKGVFVKNSSLKNHIYSIFLIICFFNHARLLYGFYGELLELLYCSELILHKFQDLRQNMPLRGI